MLRAAAQDNTLMRLPALRSVCTLGSVRVWHQDTIKSGTKLEKPKAKMAQTREAEAPEKLEGRGKGVGGLGRRFGASMEQGSLVALGEAARCEWGISA